MATRKFPISDSGFVSFWYNGYTYFGEVEVRRFQVIVTIFNGYSIMFATFTYRKADLMRNEDFLTSLDTLKLFYGQVEPSFMEDPVKRVLCNMALKRLSPRSQRILHDSYICTADLHSHVLNMLSR